MHVCAEPANYMLAYTTDVFPFRLGLNQPFGISNASYAMYICSTVTRTTLGGINIEIWFRCNPHRLQGVLTLGPPEAGRQRMSSVMFFAFFLLVCSTHIYQTAKLENDRSPLRKTKGKTSRGPLDLRRVRYHQWKSDDAKTQHHQNIPFGGINRYHTSSF